MANEKPGFVWFKYFLSGNGTDFLALIMEWMSAVEWQITHWGFAMSRLRMLIPLLILFTVNTLTASDWHYVSMGESEQGVTMDFYDSDSVKIENKVIRVWVKQMLADDVHTSMNAHKEYLTKAYKKVSDGKIPWAWTMLTNKPKSDVDKINFIAGIFSWEMAASFGDLSPVYTVLYEIDFNIKKYKVLSVKLKSKSGENIGSEDIENPQSQFIPPDTEIGMLSEYLYWVYIKYDRKLDVD